jgi:hypothetical protein
MTSEATTSSGEALEFRPWEVFAAIVVVVVGAIVAWRALHSVPTYDIGLAYEGGVAAWATGHPENLNTWISTPFLGAAMGVASRVLSQTATAWALTAINILVVAGAYASIWWHLRRRATLSRTFWWGTLLAAVVFAPMISSLWWKQLNLVALALAGVAFLVLRRGRDGLGSLVLALSLLIKPLAILLPVALLLRRETRRAGVLTIGWGVALVAFSQLIMAQRAGSLSALNPLPAWDNFSHKSQPANIWVCHTENFSPQSALCRLTGSEDFTLQRIVVIGGVLLLGAFAFLVLRTSPGRSWRVFAFACLLSPMISPIAWSHYQVMLLPMFLVLAVELYESAAPWVLWIGLLGAYALAELIWRPAISLPAALNSWFSGAPESTVSSFRVMNVAMLSQYLLYLVALLWFAIRGTPLARRSRRGEFAALEKVERGLSPSAASTADR